MTAPKKCCYKLNLTDLRCQECGHQFSAPSKTWQYSDIQKVVKAEEKILKLAVKTDDTKIRKQAEILEYYRKPEQDRT